MNFQLLIPMIIAIGFFVVMVPVVLTTYRQFLGPRTVVCPETGGATEIELDAWHAAISGVRVPGKHSRWR